MAKITFKKANFTILGYNECGHKYGIVTRKEINGYTFFVPGKGYYYFCLRQVNGMWEVTHAITGLSIGVREKTREKAAGKALEMLPRVLESLKGETMKKALEAYENAPLEDVVKLWGTMEYTTLKDKRLVRIANMAEELKLHIRKNCADYQHGGKITISGLPKDLEIIKELIAEFEREDAALRTPAAETEPAKDKIIGHSITPAGTVVLFYESGKREKFGKGAAGYDAALEAAEHAPEETTTETTAADPEEQTAAETTAADPEEQTAADPEPKAAEQAEPEEREEAEMKAEQAAEQKRQVPEKTFAGTEITGKGWKIVFNAQAERTQIMFATDPIPAAKKILEKERFFYSSIMKTWNKKLTWKAYRAALRTAEQLKKIYA